MHDKEFIWDENKHKANKRKHGISFEEAGSVFDDEEGIDLSDIPDITDFSKGRKNPFAGMFKNGYTITVEHKDFDEIITVTKTRRDKKDNIAQIV